MVHLNSQRRNLVECFLGKEKVPGSNPGAGSNPCSEVS